MLWQWCSRKLELCRLQMGPMGTMCLPPGMKSKITLMGGMLMPTKLAISFLPLTCTACTPMFTAWLFICLMSRPLTFLRGPRLGKPWCATTPPLWLGGVTSTERPNLNTRLQPLWLATATTLHRHYLLRWPHCTQIIPKSLCGANPKRHGTSGKGQRGGRVLAETIMSHWELWGACTLCNPQRASIIICEFCLPTLQGPHALRTSELPTSPTRLLQLCTPLLKLHALQVACCKMMLNGTNAFQKLLACNSPEACGSFFPACWFSTTSPILGGCGIGIREPLRRISCTKHARGVAKRPPQRKCILQASLSLGCDGISCALLSSLNYCLETSLLNGRLLDSMYQKTNPSASFHTFHLMSLTTYWCCKSHWIAFTEPKAKLLQVVLNKLLDPIADQISLLVVSMNNCALLDYNPPPPPPCPRLRRAGNAQPAGMCNGYIFGVIKWLHYPSHQCLSRQRTQQVHVSFFKEWFECKQNIPWK